MIKLYVTLKFNVFPFLITTESLLCNTTNKVLDVVTQKNNVTESFFNQILTTIKSFEKTVSNAKPQNLLQVLYNLKL